MLGITRGSLRNKMRALRILVGNTVEVGNSMRDQVAVDAN
jgi:hypothetical protein